MDKDEFEQAYARRSGVSVEWLHARGLFAEPCYCDHLGYEGCEGWAMGYQR